MKTLFPNGVYLPLFCLSKLKMVLLNTNASIKQNNWYFCSACIPKVKFIKRTYFFVFIRTLITEFNTKLHGYCAESKCDYCIPINRTSININCCMFNVYWHRLNCFRVSAKRFDIKTPNFYYCFSLSFIQNHSLSV